MRRSSCFLPPRCVSASRISLTFQQFRCPLFFDIRRRPEPPQHFSLPQKAAALPFFGRVLGFVGEPRTGPLSPSAETRPGVFFCVFFFFHAPFPFAHRGVGPTTAFFFDPPPFRFAFMICVPHGVGLGRFFLFDSSIPRGILGLHWMVPSLRAPRRFTPHKNETATLLGLNRRPATECFSPTFFFSPGRFLWAPRQHPKRSSRPFSLAHRCDHLALLRM